MWTNFIWFHRVTVTLTFDRESHFSLLFFLKSFLEALWTRVELSIEFHLQTNREFEHTILNLKDMRVFILDFGGTYNVYLPLAKLSYNNSFPKNKKSSDESIWNLVGRQCHSHVRWFEVGESKVLGIDLVQESMDKAQFIRKRLLTAQSRTKSRR